MFSVFFLMEFGFGGFLQLCIQNVCYEAIMIILCKYKMFVKNDKYYLVA